MMKRIAPLLVALAIAAPVNALLIYDLSLTGDVVGEGQVTFDDTTLTDFEFTIAPETGGPAPLPFSFGFGDVQAAEWDIYDGVLDYFYLATNTVIDGDAMYDLSLSLYTRKAKKKAPAKKKAGDPDPVPGYLSGELISTLPDVLDCGERTAAKKKAPVKKATKKAAKKKVAGAYGYGDFCSSDLNADDQREVVFADGDLAVVDIPEPPVLGMIALGLILVRYTRRRHAPKN